MKIKPSIFLIIYVLLIVVYALVYRCLWQGINAEDFTFFKSLYFSTVTITTLGYGDILPLNNITMAIVASEAIAGIVIIGLFLSSLWQSFANRIEEQQNEAIRKQLYEQNLHGILTYYKYLNVVIRDFKVSLVEVTTPMAKRKDLKQPNPGFLFSDLQDLYFPSLLVKSGMSKAVVHLYFDRLDSLSSELKYVLSSFDLTEHPKLHDIIVQLLVSSRELDVRDALYAYENKTMGSTTITETIVGMIKEHTECPDLEKYQSNILTPIIILYMALKSQMDIILKLETEFNKLIPHHDD